MDKNLPCYIITDLLPFYQDDVLSEETKQDIDKHISECEECKKIMENMKMQINTPSAKNEITNNPFRKIRSYQKMQTVLGAVITFFMGMCLPIVRSMITIFRYGEIPDYYLARLKITWQIGLLKMLLSGFIVCVLYLMAVFLMKKLVSRHR